MQSFVLTGAAGHIGFNLLIELLKNPENKIKILLKKGRDTTIFKGMNIDIKYGDVRDINFLRQEINTDDIVFHLAAIIDISNGDKEELYQTNVEGTRNVAKVCLEKNVKRLVYTSSVHAIVPLKNNVLLTEPTEFDETKVVGDYAKSKILATKFVFDCVKKGLDAVVVYPSGVIGPNDVRFSEMGAVIIEIANKRINSSIVGAYNFVDVRDVANALIVASQKGKSGEGYILSGENIDVSRLLKIVNSKFGRKSFVPQVSLWVVKMFLPIIALYYRLSKKKPLFTKYSVYTLNSNHNFSNEKAKKDLDFKTRSAKQSIYDSIDWLVENRKDLFKQKVLKEYFYHN